MQDAQLRSGARLHIVHSDVARGGQLMVNIRKFTGVSFRSLSQLVERGMLGHEAAAILRAAVAARCSKEALGYPRLPTGPRALVDSSRKPEACACRICGRGR
ncbi:MAG: hypothetical protein ACKVWR_00525 [Acidimicrobiales bacterium]